MTLHHSKKVRVNDVGNSWISGHFQATDTVWSMTSSICCRDLRGNPAIFEAAPKEEKKDKDEKKEEDGDSDVDERFVLDATLPNGNFKPAVEGPKLPARNKLSFNQMSSSWLVLLWTFCFGIFQAIWDEKPEFDNPQPVSTRLQPPTR